MGEIKLVRVEARPSQHAVGDKRTPTAYDVFCDDERIGTVRSHSEQSWRKSGRIRTGLIGYAREWRGCLDGNYDTSFRGCDVYSYWSRKECVANLVGEWQKKKVDS